MVEPEIEEVNETNIKEPDVESKPKPKLDPYQPTHFLVNGKLVTFIDKNKNEKVERVIIANNEAIIDVDNWKHQSKPINVARPNHWTDLGLYGAV